MGIDDPGAGLHAMAVVLVVGAYALGTLLAAAYYVLQFRFLRHLEVDCPFHYVELGKPDPLFASTDSGEFSMTRYLLGKEYLALSDRRAVRLASRLREVYVSLLFLLGFGILCCLVMWMTD